VIPGIFHLTLVHNRGIAFGLFSQFPWLLMAVVTVSLILITWISHRPAFRKPLDQWVFGLILGGALGNWLDRVLYGAVIDYFDFRVWPVFNIADSAISIGVGIYLFYLLRQPQESKSS